MFLPKDRALLFFMFLLIQTILPAQGGIGGTGNFIPEENDPVNLVGLTLGELLGRFGTPRSVYAARGIEEWQDDVVFVYDEGDFYVYKDRVWQAGLKEAHGIKAGDSRAVVSLVLGQAAEDRGDSIYCPLEVKGWPLMLRYVFDREGRLHMIFIYRTDF